MELLDLRAHVDAGARLVEAGDVHDERELLDEAPVATLRLADPDLRVVALLERLARRAPAFLQALVTVVERPRDPPEDREERAAQEQKRQSERDAHRRDRSLDLGPAGS